MIITLTLFQAILTTEMCGHRAAHTFIHHVHLPCTTCVCGSLYVWVPSALMLRQLKANKGHNTHNVNSLLLSLWHKSQLSGVSVYECQRTPVCLCEIWWYANKKSHGYVGHVSLFFCKAYTPLSHEVSTHSATLYSQSKTQNLSSLFETPVFSLSHFEWSWGREKNIEPEGCCIPDTNTHTHIFTCTHAHREWAFLI